jgi:trimethylamine---corrinoid protein Co-methyltransferase
LVDMAEFVTRGVDASDYKLALDAIARVGPGGNFLTDSLTIEQLRSNEFFESPYLDLTGGYTQEAPGMAEIAHREVERLVDQYQPTVPEKVQEAIRSHFRKKYRDAAVADL